MSSFRPTTRPTPVPAPYAGPGDRSASRTVPPEVIPPAPFVSKGGREWARTPVWDAAVAIPTPPQLTIVAPGAERGDAAPADGAGQWAARPPGGAWQLEGRGADPAWVAACLEELAARVRSGAVVIRELAPDAAEADVLAAVLRAVRPFPGAVG